MPGFINIAAYQFAPLTDLKALRERLLQKCKGWGLRGTILLSTEGINLFAAGSKESIDALLAEIRAIPGLENFQPKFSESEEQPFNRMLVRIKKEIIAFGVPGIDPSRQTAPKLAPQDLKRWLDEGRSVTLLDTRNDYEVKLGTFTNAMTLDLDHFRNFPAAVAKLPAALKDQPIVMFCTGGIRCEKAGPYMQREGFQQVMQLEGGILKYFEECGGAHYEGECFVFDQRVGLDPTLAETDNTQCFRCQMPLTATDQQDRRYVVNESCPYCFQDSQERMAGQIVERQQQIAKIATPLPGSLPYANERPVNIPQACEGRSLLEALCTIFPHVSREQWEAECNAAKFVDLKRRPVIGNTIVHAGDRLLHRTPISAEPDVNAAIKILHEDEAIIVVDKPAPLPLHPCGRFNRNTLQFILNEVYRPQKLRPAHRLDANTTGLVVLARTKHFARCLQLQFSSGEVQKTYLARIQGYPTEDAFSCDMPISREAGEIGSRNIDEDGLPAQTEFRVLKRLADGTAMIEAVPLTGRTNQIRVHLWQLGWPLAGEQAYLPQRELGQAQTHTTSDPPLCLHAKRLAFRHPLTNEIVSFETEDPAWASER